MGRDDTDYATRRDARGLTQEELAHLAGVSVSTVQAAEAGRSISARSRRRITAALDDNPVINYPDRERLERLERQAAALLEEIRQLRRGDQDTAASDR